MIKKSNPRRDFTQVAFNVVQQATGDAASTKLTGKKADSRKGGLKGGKTRMGKLTDAERSELARQAANARWHSTAPATKTSAAKPGSAKQR